jgi:vancomycin resistance protein YoaR
LHKALKIVGFAAALALLIALAFVGYDFFKTRQAFPPKTFIGAIDVSDLTQDEADAKLKSYSLAEIFTPIITLESKDFHFAFPPEDLGITILYDDCLRNAFELTHKESYLKDLKDRLKRGAVMAPLVLKIDENKLRAELDKIAPAVACTPKDASFLFYEETGGFHVESEEAGRELDISKSVDLFKSSLQEGKREIPLFIKYAYPRVTEKILRAYPPVTRLSAYTTYYGTHDSPNRIHNIKLIASWVNDRLLMPGENFSVAEIIGEVTPDRGFKEAYVIMGGELVPLLGGGACQVATTLYNAVQLADLKVLQRRNHSFYFNIYPLGLDAGVYPGQLDFRFNNDTGQPVLIKSVATNKRLSFRIYGTPTGKTVKMSPPAILGRGRGGVFVPMSLRQVIAYDVPFKTSVVRTVYDKEGNKIEEEVIGSYYKLYGEKSNVPIRRPESR